MPIGRASRGHWLPAGTWSTPRGPTGSSPGQRLCGRRGDCRRAVLAERDVADVDQAGEVVGLRQPGAVTALTIPTGEMHSPSSSFACSDAAILGSAWSSAFNKVTTDTKNLAS
jgi:hypothetical protein